MAMAPQHTGRRPLEQSRRAHGRPAASARPQPGTGRTGML